MGAEPEKRGRLLFVEDNPHFRLPMVSELREEGYEVDEADDGLAAWERFVSNGGGKVYAAVITDLRMPRMDGLELASRLHRAAPDLPVVLLTAYEDAEVVKAALRMGVRDFVEKPVDIERLLERLEELLSKRQQPKRLLLAEDEAVTREAVALVFRKAGYRTDVACDGREAWDLFRRCPTSDPYSLLVTDVAMPEMSGLELVKRIHDNSPGFPVVVLTGHGDPATMKEAIRAGVDEFVTKPVEREALLKAVERTIVESPWHGGGGTSARETVEAVDRAQSILTDMGRERCADCMLQMRLETVKEAGGDVFRCFKLEDGSCLLALVDVAGHSVESSYALASFLGMFGADRDKVVGLEALVRELNRDIGLGPFRDIPVCLLLGHWSPWSGRLHLINAGFPHSCLLRSRDGKAGMIALDGSPLGFFDDALSEERVLMLAEGDRVLMGSDGLFETVSPSGHLFADRALQLWRDLRDCPLDEVLSAVHKAAREWGGGAMADDFLAVGIEQPARAGREGVLVSDVASNLECVDELCVRLRGFVKSEAVPLDLDEEGLFDVVLAAREALVNAVRHGNQGRPLARLGLRSWEEEGRLHVAVTDEGPGVRGDDVGGDMDELREGGRGLRLMRELADEVHLIPGEVGLVFEHVGGNRRDAEEEETEAGNGNGCAIECRAGH